MKLIFRSISAAGLFALSLSGCQSKEQTTTTTTETVASSPQIPPSSSGSFPEQAPVSTAPTPPIPPAAAQTPPFTVKMGKPNSSSAIAAPEDMIAAIGKIPRISPAELKSELEEGKVLLLDVRAGSFTEGHIPGARHLPLAQLPLSMATIPKDKKIVTYCA